MINFYKTVESSVTEIEEFESGCWVNIVAPNEDKLIYAACITGVDIDLLRAPLDAEESSRAEVEEDSQTFLIVDIPLAEKDGENIIYTTIPLGFVITPNCMVTVCLKENTILKSFSTGMVKGINTRMRTRFVLQIFYRIATRYLQYLKQINRLSSDIEMRLHKSMKNRELIQLLDLEKSLVYFGTSLRGNELVMRKIARGKIIPLYEDDEDLLDDVIVEFQQAVEMSNIYSNILSGTMDAFASIISNNLNIVMKFLSAITIIMAVPQIIAGIYGMNVANLPFAHLWWFPILISALGCIIVAWIMNRKNMF